MASQEAKAGGALVGIGCLWVIAAFSLGAYLTEYTLEFWLSYAKGVPVDLPFLLCGFVALFVQPVVLPAALVTYLISFAL